MESRRGSAIVPSDRTMATSYVVLIATMFSFAAVWTQFLMKCFKLGVSRLSVHMQVTDVLWLNGAK